MPPTPRIARSESSSRASREPEPSRKRHVATRVWDYRLAAVGIYGVVSYAVTRRYREIGIRMALGASARSVLGMVLRRTLRPVAIGAVIGVAAAIAVSGILSSVLFGVSPAIRPGSVVPPYSCSPWRSLRASWPLGLTGST
jgi:ABC-type antimicrobial peptide transport system permease subunit